MDELLKRLPEGMSNIEVVRKELFQLDSANLQPHHWQDVASAVKQASEEMPDLKGIIITHGTWILPKTAKFLGRKNLPKTIVLVGAIIPVNKKNSDALFNLGAAFTAVQTLPKGVYVTMNGKIFSWENVKKEKGYFVTEK